MTWQLQEAKNKLSQVIDDSLSKGPQIISRRGKETAVVMSYAQYRKFAKPARTLKDLVRDYKGPEMPDIPRDSAVPERAASIDFNDIDV